MIRSVYQTSMSMLVQQKKQEAHANNLANVETAGYKSQALVSEAAFSEVFVNHASGNGAGAVILGSMPMGVRVAGTETDWTQGMLVETGRDMDLALEGPGFLAFESPQGIVYSRNGALHQNQAGEWVDPSGFRLMASASEGDLKAVRSLPGEALTFSASGELFGEDGTVLGHLPVYGALGGAEAGLGAGLELLDGGYVRIAPDGLIELEGTRLRQGMMESSNVNSTSTMIDMMSTGRLLQTQQRVLSTLDETLNRAVNEIGKV
ncbi:flagellar hook-basal body protein [Acidaminobacter hydrogenoformans]|uniref:Flagellar basal-body rod protein FlgG n=1 Tax=Acidaminobacter hydrogenoformans DSM 2784 TaxID=1120920 RepID=A0A1G5RUD5_9FIRM|nr:flagellar hook-basal body complex protein [Acidaminobacter hydrogenoformans]SCZ77755.1 flagellar basal-body rod protein FlgG [Acidaminobacter hydrogenoformans DSM 2784]